MTTDNELFYINDQRIEINSISELSMVNINEKYDGNSNLQLLFNLSLYDPDTIKRIVSFVKEVKDRGLNVTVGIMAQGKHFTATDMRQLLELEDALKSNNIDLKFDGGINKDYDINEVLIAQQKLNGLIESIKKQNFSPFEKYLLIYDFLTRKIYKENESNKSKSRDIIALMNGDDIVCVGYAQLMEYICNAVGIKCYTQTCRVYNQRDKFIMNHENNLVYIDDDKYNIHGMYYSDACWDHVDKGFEDKRTYSFCLLPLLDKNKMGKKIKINDDSMFYYPEDEYMFKIIDGDYYGSTFGKTINGDYSKIIKQLGLEEKYSITEAFVRDVMSDEFKRKMAVAKLKELFIEKNVPSDIYRNNSNVPFGCSFEFLLSMCLFNEIDKPFLAERIKLLKKHYNSGKKLDITDSARSYVADVYSEFDNLMETKPLFESESVNDTYSTRWESVENKFTKSIMAGSVYKTLSEQNLNTYGEPIPVEKFKAALPEVYKYENLPLDKIEHIAQEAIDDTKTISSNFFNNSATNSFKVESMKEGLISGTYVEK